MTIPSFGDVVPVEADAVARVVAAAAERLGLYLGDERQVLGAASIAITRMAWRDSRVEDWHAVPHSRISDADLMRANVAVTREIRGLLTAAQGGGSSGVVDGRDLRADLAVVAAALTASGRRLPDGRRLDQFAPDAVQFAAYTEHVVALVRRWA